MFDVASVPDPPGCKDSDRLGKVIAARKLIDSLDAHAQNFGDLGKADEVHSHPSLTLDSLKARPVALSESRGPRRRMAPARGRGLHLNGGTGNGGP